MQNLGGDVRRQIYNYLPTSDVGSVSRVSKGLVQDIQTITEQRKQQYLAEKELGLVRDNIFKYLILNPQSQIVILNDNGAVLFGIPLHDRYYREYLEFITSLVRGNRKLIQAYPEPFTEWLEYKLSRDKSNNISFSLSLRPLIPNTRLRHEEFTVDYPTVLSMLQACLTNNYRLIETNFFPSSDYPTVDNLPTGLQVNLGY